MDESGTQLAPASATSCCSIPQAPIPQSPFKGSDVSQAAPMAVLNPTGETPRIHRLVPVLIVQELSPLRLQPLLCTFLI